jgi:hypothetical protein
MTTSTFSKDASQLAELRFESGTAVATVNAYAIKHIDSYFFEEEIPAVLGEATVK